ncbi:sensor histidine kinase [Nakamurella silvestris]|nr:sensor histidine kinase [Nakamurella silvestris]
MTPTVTPGVAPVGSWWDRRTLRFRLTAGVVTLLFVACVVVGIATTLSLRSFLTDRLDQQIDDAGGRYAISLEHGRNNPGGQDGDADNQPAGQSVGTLGVRLVNGKVQQGAVLESDGTNRILTFDDADQAVLAGVPVNGGPVSITLSALGSYRVQAIAGRDGDVQLTGLPLHPVEDTLERLLIIEIIVFLGVLAVGALVAALSVRLTLRPLNRVADSALHVAAMPLSSGHMNVPVHLPTAPPSTEIGQVTAAFEKMIQHLGVSIAARNHTEAQLRQFVADASHELRTPLSVIRSHTDLALDRPDTDLPSEVRDSLERIAVHTARMSVLVEDLLLLARLDTGTPAELAAVDLSRLTVEAVSDAAVAGPDHHWHLDLPEDPVTVTGNEQHLHQVLANLLANARLHTPSGTKVRIHLPPPEHGEAVLEVIDDGPGIPDEIRRTVFDRFSRGDSARASTGGTGLGLAIAHALVTADDGTITVQSEPGRTAFRVVLPLGTTSPGSPEAAGPSR